MKTETFQKASEIIKKIVLISDNIVVMERGHGEILYFTDIFLNEMEKKHRQEVVEAFRIRKTELEQELADL